MSLGVAVLGAGAWYAARSIVPEARVMASPKRVIPTERPSDGQAVVEDERPHTFRVPSGEPPALACDAARMIVAQVRRNLAYSPDPIAPRAFASATGDWLDPYGLWTVAPDTPLGAALDKRAADLLADVEGRGTPDCTAARDVGRVLAAWVDDLRALYDRERLTATVEDVSFAAADPVFEGATVTRPARALASILAQRVRSVERGLGASGDPYVAAARSRYFPTLDEDAWSRVVLAATVRAYVPMVDPHGAWAPLDEEASVYEVDLEARPPGRLWDKSTRTAIGLRIDTGAVAPLRTGDVVLSLAGVTTTGMPLEQLEQLGFATTEARIAQQAVVFRSGDRTPRTLTISPVHDDPLATAAASDAPAAAGAVIEELTAERIAFGNGDALVVPIRDVRDDIGDDLTRLLLRERERDARPIAGVILDLRGNGGGSTDGAVAALGIFLPGAPLFPMKRRDGSLETDRAPEPPNVDRWTGPVATLVDSETASAAEMIAGALTAYHRGPSIGTITFGKGCAQEYLDDAARAGVLRLTTLLYALPDGAAVQRIGLTPTIRFPFAPQPGASSRDREALLPHAPPSWRGPDVRDRAILAKSDDGTWTTTWPAHGGGVGPCKDPDVCRALRALGASMPPKRVAKVPN